MNVNSATMKEIKQKYVNLTDDFTTMNLYSLVVRTEIDQPSGPLIRTSES